MGNLEWNKLVNWVNCELIVNILHTKIISRIRSVQLLSSVEQLKMLYNYSKMYIYMFCTDGLLVSGCIPNVPIINRASSYNRTNLNKNGYCNHRYIINTMLLYNIIIPVSVEVQILR